MSFSMWAWRVVVPGGGLLACLLVFWASVGSGVDPRGRAGDDAPPAAGAAATPEAAAAAGRVVADGRVVSRPGAEVTVGTEAGGLVVELAVREKARVRKGDLLVRFRPADREAAVAEAEAGVAEADAELAFQKREVTRRAKAPLDSQRFAAEADSGRRDYEIAAARRKAAGAVLDQGRAALAQTRVTSPIDGVVLACLVQTGETAPAGARLVTVCDLSRTRVEAEVDEFDAQRVTLGADVTITAEGHGRVSWRGTVEEVPDVVTGRTVRPVDPGRPTDTGVLLVKIAPAGPLPLKLGQQVGVEISPPAVVPPDPK